MKCRLHLFSLKSHIRYSSSKSGGGPPKEKVMAIPFAQHVKAAEKVTVIF
jgi:hypothetical protein